MLSHLRGCPSRYAMCACVWMECCVVIGHMCTTCEMEELLHKMCIVVD